MASLAVTATGSAAQAREDAARHSTALLCCLGLTAFLVASHMEAAVQTATSRPAVAAVSLSTAVLAAVWAARVGRHPTSATLLVGALGTTVLVVLWVSTRTVGLPVKAPMGVLDTVSAVDELLLATYCLMAARRPLAGERVCSLIGLLAISTSFVALAMGCSPGRSVAQPSGSPTAAPSLLCHLF